MEIQKLLAVFTVLKTKSKQLIDWWEKKCPDPLLRNFVYGILGTTVLLHWTPFAIVLIVAAVGVKEWLRKAFRIKIDINLDLDINHYEASTIAKLIAALAGSIVAVGLRFL